jgi:class 3 adenylate cyclase
LGEAKARAVEPERRQVSVLFVDMVGFTAFSDRAGEEAAFTLMQSLAKPMEDAVREQGGVVQSFTGDGIMAVFGAPVAFEDAALRACRAAMAILEKLKSAGDDLEAKHGVRPQLRIGLNSGPAVVGKVQGGSDSGVTVLGDTVNVAARLQALAEPGSTVMSEATHRLVEGLVEAGFAGEHQVKGKSEAQKVYRLDGVRERATRFDAKIQRGLTRYVGRDRELEKLERGLDAIGGAGVQVFDIVGEPGIGKSRLLHEFLGQIVKDRARVLTGSCTPDGQQTPYRAFIEIVRGAFRLSPGDVEPVVARKLEEGLEGLGLSSQENLNLLLNLLGLKPPALEGLDGVLVGLRTRGMLEKLASVRSRLTPLILVFEDLHWLDTASEDLLTKIVAIEEPLKLLVLHTRRPEYSPPWASPRMTRLSIGPLSAGDTSRIAEARLGVSHLPETLANLILARAEGNALFAEEIAIFLLERGIVSRGAAGLEFDQAAVAVALPESVQSLLASRVDGLASTDRHLLQVGAVIGRRFDPELAALVGGANGNSRAAFAAMEALDLIYRAERSTEYVFKHALVREALYNRLLRSSRSALHLKVAEELERRSGNRQSEIAEVLAHHYAKTERNDKAFAYLAMAGDKSLDVYSIAEAEQYYRQSLAVFEVDGSCALRPSVAQVVVRLLETLTHENADLETGQVARRYMPFIQQGGETTDLVIASYYEAVSLLGALDIRTGHDLMVRALAIATRLGEGRARSYARTMLAGFKLVLGLDSIEVARRANAEMMEDALRFGDNNIHNWSHVFLASDYLFRGLIKQAREVAMQLIASGEKRGDPRALGQANLVLGYIDMIGHDDPVAAKEHAEECLRVAVTPNERRRGALVIAISKIFLGRAREGLTEIKALNSIFERSGSLYLVQTAPQGAALAMLGRISEGIRVIEHEVAQSDAVGYQFRATWGRIILAEIYIQILTGKEKLNTAVLFKNFSTIAAAILFGAGRARALLLRAAAAKMLSERGVIMARINFDLGVLSSMKKKRGEAKMFFEKARVGAESQGADKLLEKIDTALAGLQ